MVSIGVLAPVTGGFFIGEVLAGIVSEAAASGAHVAVIQTLDAGSTADGMEPPASAALVAAQSVDGFVALPWATDVSLVRRLRAEGHPVVLVCSDFDVDAARVSPDNWDAVQDVVRHLAAHGHSKIHFVGDSGNSDVRERLAAYAEAMAELGLPAPDALETEGNLEEGGRAISGTLLSLRARPTAVLAATDLVALGLMKGLDSLGCEVPGEIAIVGFDDVEAGWHHKPALATVHQDFTGLGTRAAAMLLAEIRGEPVPRSRQVAPSTFVPRQSCGCGQEGLERLEALGSTFGHNLASILLVDRGGGEARPAADDNAFPAVLTDAAEQLIAERLPPEATAHAARTFVESVLRDAPDRSTTNGPDPDRILRLSVHLSVALLRAEAARGHSRASRLSTTLGQQYDVGVGLLNRAGGDPSSLGWLRGSAVTVGCLGLWRRGYEGRRLRLAGVHDPAARLAEPLPEESVVEAFPPREVIRRADAAAGEVAYVVPVRGESGDHGLLCVVGSVESENGTTRGTYNNWAALLGAALLQRQMMEELRLGEERLTLAARATRDGLWDWDTTTGDCFYSERSRELLGDSGRGSGPEPLRGLWLDNVLPEDRPRVERAVTRAVRDLVPLEVDFRVPTDAGQSWVQCRAFPVGDRGASATRLVGAFSDVHGRKKLEERLRFGALHDPVTGLPNRRSFLEQAGDVVRDIGLGKLSATERGSAIAFIDLDDFKRVNDSLGHRAGDALLRVVGSRLLAEVRDTDVAARLGGDEFALLIVGMDADAVVAVVERILARISDPVELSGSRVDVTASAGVALLDAGWGSAEEALHAADEAMYHAKRDGKATVRVWGRH